MTYDQIRQLVEMRIMAWGQLPVEIKGVPRSQAVKDAVSNGEDWAQLVLQYGDSNTAEVGSRPIPDRTGVIRITIYISQQNGARATTKPAADMADSLAQQFEYWQEGGIVTQAASTQDFGLNGQWVEWDVTIPFRAR